MDFAPYLTAMKEADCCLYWQMEIPSAPFFIQYHDFGVKMPIVMPLCGCASEVILAEVGDPCLGMVGSDFYTPLIDTDINRRFVDAYKEKYGIYPRGESAGGYIAMLLYLEAVKATGGDTTRGLILDALKQLAVDTPAGPRSFTPGGVGVGNLYIMKVIKIGDRYCWDVIYTYSDIVLDIPK